MIYVPKREALDNIDRAIKEHEESIKMYERYVDVEEVKKYLIKQTNKAIVDLGELKKYLNLEP